MHDKRYTFTVYYHVDAGMQLVNDDHYLWIPGEDVHNGARFILLTDLLERTGMNAQTKPKAREYMKDIEKIYERDLHTWKEDGTEEVLGYADLPIPIGRIRQEGDRWSLLAHFIRRAFKKM